MLILKNIKKINGCISADYYPEGAEPHGSMKINIDTLEIEEHIRPPKSFMAPAHAERELIRLSKLDNLPKEKIVLWF